MDAQSCVTRTMPDAPECRHPYSRMDSPGLHGTKENHARDNNRWQTREHGIRDHGDLRNACFKRGVRTASCVYRRLRGCASPQRANSGIWQGIWEGSCSSIDSRSPGQNSLDHGPWAGHGERKGVGFVGDCRRLWNVPGARSRHPGSAPEGGCDVGEPPRDGRQRRLGCPRSL